MHRPEKWQPGVSAASKVRSVARQALAARLERVGKNLKRSAQPQGQADNIHRLRTWCRRSAAAVELFRPLLPKKEARWFARKLKKIRQAAGDVRDLDVMLEQATDNPPLAEELTKQRDKASQPLGKLHKRLQSGNEFDKRQRRLLAKIDQPKKRLGDWSASRVGKQAAALVGLGERSLRALEAAHEFRIACKELRYVLEIVGSALPMAAVRVYALLGDLQQRIGIVCDQAAAEKMYRELLMKVGRPQREPLRAAIAKAKKARAKLLKAFLRWWTRGRRAAFHKMLVQAGLLEG
ncbi:MAG: CHAD domain-containing protein [Pirellulaceae bacterium]|nr:CHAD domain-containing protein [Pirellulaceae bacterium]